MRKALRSGATKTVRRRLPEASAGSVRAESPPTATGLEAELAELERLSLDDLRLRWRNNWGRLAPAHLSRGLLFRVMAYRLQAEAFGDLDRKAVGLLERMTNGAAEKLTANGSGTPRLRCGIEDLVGSSGLRAANPEAWGVADPRVAGPARAGDRRRSRIRMERHHLCQPVRRSLRHHWHEVERPSVFRRATSR